MKHALIALLAFCSSLTSTGQTEIHGCVLSVNGDTISGANVFITGTMDGTTSRANGEYRFNTLKTGKCTLQVSMMGFELFQKMVDLNGGSVLINAALREKVSELNAVVINAGSIETGDVKKMSVLNSIDIATTAGATADIYGALRTLPGVLPQSESNGLLVRGGDAGESRTYFDGMLVKNPFTSDLPDIAGRGRFSPFMFKGTSFTTGAYPAAYGGAMSSAMMLESKDLPEKTKSDIGIMSVGLDAAHAQRFKNSSVEANASYYNLKPAFTVIPQNVHWQKAPEAVNANIFCKWKTGDKGMIKFFAANDHSLTGLETYNISDIRFNSVYNIRRNSGYIYSGWQQFVSSNWKVNGGVSFSNEVQNIALDDNLIRTIDNALHVKASVVHYMKRLSTLTAGVEYFSFFNSESFNEIQHEFHIPQEAAFIESNIYITGDVAVRPGLRMEQCKGHNEVSPRISLAWKTGKNSQSSAGYGTFTQLPPDEYLYSGMPGQERANHYVLNYLFSRDEKMFRAEVYYKDYAKLIRTNDKQIISLEGNGYARGIDLFYRDKSSIKHTDFWITYSYIDTKRNYLSFDSEVTPPFVARHVLNAAAKYFITSISLSIGSTYTYASGRTYFDQNSKPAGITRDYHNFSFNLSYLTSLSRYFTIIYVSVENAPGFKNVYGYRYSPDGSVKKPVIPSARRTIFLGMFITFGDNEYR